MLKCAYCNRSQTKNHVCDHEDLKQVIIYLVNLNKILKKKQ
jgi:hypothetical protein